MSSTNELEILKQHVRELTTEINSVQKQITPYLTSKEYIALHAKFLNLSNLKAIAKNELNNHLHYYKVTLKGKKKSGEESPNEKVFRRRLISELDFKSYTSKSNASLIETDNEMFAYLKRSYSNFFAEGKFSVQRIVQIK